MIRVTGIKLSIEEEKDHIPFLVAKKLRIKTNDIIQWHIFKESVDARKKDMIYFIYTIDVLVKNEDYVLNKTKRGDVTKTPILEYEYVESGKEGLKNPPVVIGTGPAGLFAGLLLAKMGYRPILLERGDDVDTRAKKVSEFWETGELDPESNVQFGEGGAGTFSDGKLTTLISDKRCREVLDSLVQAGAPEEILYSSKPHIGTDILRNVVKNLREHIKELGGQVLFRSCVTDFKMINNEITGVVINDKEQIATQSVILAIGHSARDTFELINKKNVQLIPKPFSIGVRIEHSQDMINKAQYKDFAGHPKLGAAEYKLSYHSLTGRSAYTFCMCPGGTVVASSSELGGVVTNGMSNYARDGSNANSALLVGVTPEDFNDASPLAGIQFQRKWEQLAYNLGNANYSAPSQLVGDFLANKISTDIGNIQPTYSRGVNLTDLNQCLPNFVNQTLREALVNFDNKIKGFASEDAILTGIETRSSSPVRILRQDNYESNIAGLFPTGEGAGYAGGIISAAVDGLRAAEKLAHRFKPIDS